MAFFQKKQYQAQEQKILTKERELIEQQNEISSKKSRILQKLKDFFELAKNLEKTYDSANFDEKRELLENITSNLHVERKKLMYSIQFPYSLLVNRDISLSCPPTQTLLRNFVYESTMTSPNYPKGSRQSTMQGIV